MSEYVISLDTESHELSVLGQTWYKYHKPTDQVKHELDQHGMCYFSQDGILVYRVNLDGYLLALEATKEV